VFEYEVDENGNSGGKIWNGNKKKKNIEAAALASS
jgi:hypothetical protein